MQRVRAKHLQCEWPLADGRRTDRQLRLENAKLKNEIQELRGVALPLVTGVHEDVGHYAAEQLKQPAPAPALDAYIVNAASDTEINIQYHPGAQAAYLGIQLDAGAQRGWNDDAQCSYVVAEPDPAAEMVAPVGSAAQDAAGQAVNVFGPSVPPLLTGLQEGNM
ncbi:hypothetical protein AURDEDRAFT_128774 [Auricularia subglabra TFB-10046 SS5]|nr:hypothetical protein AURDEDRAFT_128774 [Auricularia subglabra TFB-10046 SS5]